MKILIGVDASPYSQAAVAAVAGRNYEAATQVRLVAAVEPVFAPGFRTETEENVYETARRTVEQAVGLLQAGPGRFEITTEIIEGSPKQVLLEEAESWGADLIVVGSHGRRGLDRFLLGSVSQAVALHAKCSVEIVRLPRRSAEMLP